MRSRGRGRATRTWRASARSLGRREGSIARSTTTTSCQLYTLGVDARGHITTGVVRRGCGSGGCRNGELGREDLSGLAAAWYSGSDGVEALDILAWPKATVARRC
jgi:hypothetical protein